MVTLHESLQVLISHDHNDIRIVAVITSVVKPSVIIIMVSVTIGISPVQGFTTEKPLVSLCDRLWEN